MKPICTLLAILIINCGFGQVDNYDLLAKNIPSSGIKSITKYERMNFHNRIEKKFMIEFDTNGKLMLAEKYAYDFPFDDQCYLQKKSEFVYSSAGNNVAMHETIPGISLTIDTLIYNERNELIEKRRIVNGIVRQTWDYSAKMEDDIDERVYDARGNLIKEIYNYENYTTFAYDSKNNLIEWVIIRDDKILSMEIYEYDSNNRLIAMDKCYKSKIEAALPMRYYFEYKYY